MLVKIITQGKGT